MPLPLIAIVKAKEIELFGCLDAFGNDLSTNLACEGEQGAGQGQPLRRWLTTLTGTTAKQTSASPQ